MRRAMIVMILGLTVALVVGAPATAAPGPRLGPAHRVDVQAWAGTAVQGGALLVVARVRLPLGPARWDAPPVASAVVHFASGDVSVDLDGRFRGRWGHRLGSRAWWAPVPVWRGVARVPVPADEQVGRVAVDVTVALGDGAVTVATFGRIRPVRRGHDPAPPPSPDPTDPCTQGCQET